MARCILATCWQDRTKNNLKNFSEIEKIPETNQNEKFSKIQKIQKFAKEGIPNKHALNQFLA